MRWPRPDGCVGRGLIIVPGLRCLLRWLLLPGPTLGVEMQPAVRELCGGSPLLILDKSGGEGPESQPSKVPKRSKKGGGRQMPGPGDGGMDGLLAVPPGVQRGLYMPSMQGQLSLDRQLL